jgi:phosphopantothenoylcysteine decarboxylase/phosphopantothenate--cysteine ligase
MNIKSSKILIGVTGGIAAYKACSLVNLLLSEGADVKVMMTDSATKFVSPLTFQSLTNSPVFCDLWNSIDRNGIEHINIAHWPDLVIIVPATANTIAKISNGIADNFLTTVILALLPKIPVIIAPAMNTNMWQHPITQINIEKLKSLKNYKIIDPRSGILACRDEGSGKVPSNESILEVVKSIL